MDINPFVGLELWRKATLELVKKDAASADLSARQTAVLLNVYLTPAPHTVRALAVDLNISRPMTKYTFSWPYSVAETRLPAPSTV